MALISQSSMSPCYLLAISVRIRSEGLTYPNVLCRVMYWFTLSYYVVFGCYMYGLRGLVLIGAYGATREPTTLRVLGGRQEQKHFPQPVTVYCSRYALLVANKCILFLTAGPVRTLADAVFKQQLDGDVVVSGNEEEQLVIIYGQLSY
eukprot:3638900-Rhodomonas_salina.1